MTYTADRLLVGVKRRVSLPASQVLLSNEDILALADDATRDRVVPLVRSVREEYFVYTTEVYFTSGEDTYDIPYRAIGRGLREIKLIDSSGNRRNIPKIAVEDEQFYRPGTIPQGFYFKGDQVVIIPTPTDPTYGLQLWWEMPPSRLVQTTSAALITSVSDPNVTVNAVPTTMTAGVLIDFIKGHAGNTDIDFDLAVTGVAGTTLTFGAGDIPSSLQAGDWIALQQESPVIQLPDDCYQFLETLTAMRVLNAISDYEGVQRLEKDASEQEKALLQILSPRIVGEPTIFVNRRSLVRGSRGRFLASGYYY